MVDQLELHVGYLQEAAVSYCKKHQIQVQAWSPLGRRRIMEQEQIQKMAGEISDINSAISACISSAAWNRRDSQGISTGANETESGIAGVYD